MNTTPAEPPPGEPEAPPLTAGPLLLLALAHALLAPLLLESREAATLHALVALGVGVLLALQDRTPHRVLCAAAYIVGAELLWRGARAAVFWEFGKYATVVVLGLTLMRRRPARLDLRLWLYLGLLWPSTLVLPAFDREAIAFNLSGPLALAIAGTYCSTVTLRPGHLQRVLVALLLPVVGLFAAAAYGTAQLESFEGIAESSRKTSAGFGPNQVSSVLGLGGLVAVLALTLPGQRAAARLLLLVLGLACLGQGALTFSRGGIYAAIGALGAVGLCAARDRRVRGRVALSAAFGALLVGGLLFPLLDDLTGGALGVRFADTHLTGRAKIAYADWYAFREHPLLGLGPGQSFTYHELTFQASSAHTEFSRLLSEHGAFGLAALLVLVSVCVGRLRAVGAPLELAMRVGCLSWAVLTMTHSAMRVAAVSLVFALGLLDWRLEAGERRRADEDDALAEERR